MEKLRREGETREDQEGRSRKGQVDREWERVRAWEERGERERVEGERGRR
jgi:hypothetical protein